MRSDVAKGCGLGTTFMSPLQKLEKSVGVSSLSASVALVCGRTLYNEAIKCMHVHWKRHLANCMTNREEDALKEAKTNCCYLTLVSNISEG